MREQDVPKRSIRLVLGPLDNKRAVVRGPGPWLFPRPVTEVAKGVWGMIRCDMYDTPANGETTIGVYIGEKR